MILTNLRILIKAISMLYRILSIFSLFIACVACSSKADFNNDFANEAWRYKSLEISNEKEALAQELNQAEALNKEHANNAMQAAQRKIEYEGRVTAAQADQLPSPPDDDASQEELDAYAEKIRALLLNR